MHRILRHQFIRIHRKVQRNPSLLWKVPLATSAVGGGTLWLGWSWAMGMSPIHVVEQSYRSLLSIYAVVQISIDYKLAFMAQPDLTLIKESDLTPFDVELQKEWEAKLDQVHERSAKRLLWVCQHNGGIFTKAGQHIASMNHILPKKYIEILSVLQDRAQYVPFSQVEKLFKTDLNRSPSEIFETIEQIPVAAASLAQVHKATLKKSGEQVAVKVQYPKLVRSVQGDLKTIDVIVTGISWAFPAFEFTWVLPEFRNNLYKELDFRCELQNALRASNDLKNRSDVHIPRVYSNLSSKRVLVMEWIDGFKVTNVKAMEKLGINQTQVASKLIDIFSEQIFVHGFVHCDPHPGNILVRAVNSKPQIVLLDHGQYRELSEDFRLNYCKLWKALVLRNLKDVQTYSEKIGAGEYSSLFSVMLTMRPPSSTKLLDTHYSVDELMEVQQVVLESQDHIAKMLKNLNRDLLFVLRTTHLLQSINIELGGGVQRFNIMARQSIKGCHRSNILEKQPGTVFTFLERVRQWKERISFEVQLALIPPLLRMRSFAFEALSPMDVPENFDIINEP